MIRRISFGLSDAGFSMEGSLPSSWVGERANVVNEQVAIDHLGLRNGYRVGFFMK